MPKESEITPFSGSSSGGSSTTPGKAERLRRVATALRWSGLAGFWLQLFLGVVSSVTLALAIVTQSERSSPGVGFSLFCAVCGLICLIVGICITFRYGKMASKFAKPNVDLPKKSTTIKMVQIAIITSISGTLITIIGGETITGLILSKTLALDPGKIFNNQNSEFVNSLDVFIVQACFNIIAAHCVGLVTSLWIYNQIDK